MLSEIRTFCLVLAIAVGAAACGEAPALPPPGDVQIEAGSSVPDGSGFVAVDDGVIVDLVPGAQGGFHVWLSMSVSGVSGELIAEHSARRVVDDGLVFRGLPTAITIGDEAIDGAWESERAVPAFMCPAPIGRKVFDEELVFEIRLLTDYDGVVLATDQVVMIPRCPDGEQSAFCMDICAG